MAKEVLKTSDLLRYKDAKKSYRTNDIFRQLNAIK